MRGKEESVEVRFWQKVIRIEGACWGWTGYPDEKGYGRIRDHRKMRLAHRVSWEIHHGPIPPGLAVCHKCDNPPCTNPDHLFLGTLSENNEDMKRKGRAKYHFHEKPAKGSEQHLAKLDDEKIAEIRRLRREGFSLQSIADRFGVTKQLIWQVLKGRIWKQVP